MAHIVVLRVEEEPAAREVGHHCGVAGVVRVVGPAVLVQQQVPVEPADGASVEVADDVVRVALAEAPLATLQRRPFAPAVPLVGGLAGQQQGRWVVPVHALQGLEAVARVPVEGHSAGPAERPRVPEERVGPEADVVLVVVVDKDLEPREAPREPRAELRGQEVQFLLGRHEAGLPLRVVLWLVLHGHGPERHAPAFVGRNPAHEVARPGRARLWPQAGRPGVVHRAVLLHPGRRRPGRGQELEPAALAPQCLLGAHNQWDQRPRIAGHRVVKVLERQVTRNVVKGVVLRGEVAAVDVHAAERVADAFGPEVALDHLPLVLGAQLCEHDCAGLGEGAPETHDCLALSARQLHHGAHKGEVWHEAHIREP
eukprot:CAMPEP_0168394316 /NCGR_PEP_ID=MMETSP0228-20121227/19469_1 /TAXON_ID=133427 /ORGANISM="Protoceratium reticulatum, Strain CCCM 535 (=CCMP 1889)" /LENGTH=368 /DNA_ID=CAMNT_0008407721 /DNA_START=326 /DNA_END=1429 /DNA_ORIENTATION=+